MPEDNHRFDAPCRGRRVVRACFIPVFALFFCVSVGAGARTVNLDQAIELALEQNRALVVSALDTDAARYGVERAESQFDVAVEPVLELGTLDNDTTTLYGMEVSKRLRAGGEVSVGATSDDFDDTIGRRARLSIEFNQPLFRRFGRLVNEEPIARASSALRRSERLYHAQRADLVLDIIESYEDILRLERQLEANDKSLDRADKLLASTRAKESLGRSTRIDTLRVELQRGLAESRLAADRERLASEYQSFAELLGLESAGELRLVPTDAFEIELPDPADAVARALDNRLDYAQAIQDVDDASRGSRIAENLLLPDVIATTRYERSNRPFSLAGEDRSRWFFGVRGDTNLNRRTARLDIERARIEEEAAAQRIRVVELGISRQVRQAMLSYRRLRADLGILDTNLENARARLELASRLFESGRTDNFSVTDAEDAFLDAQSRLFSGQSQATLGAYRFLYTIGVLVESPDYLKPGALP